MAKKYTIDKWLVPEPFYKTSQRHVRVRNVADVKAALALLPDDMPIDGDNNCLIVTNIASPEWGTRLRFTESEMEEGKPTLPQKL
jgi:hypothetical protein